MSTEEFNHVAPGLIRGAVCGAEAADGFVGCASFLSVSFILDL